ncbi:hypothetical protein [Streptomyces sp. AcE210]|uniref:hypothetical protein n=1 Tax=Streptomyces sp. AcE210 TaxID=2292703 RepID=UPI000E2FF871|nr:hypothetical protein [Streptomyces sp. AcE210]RFC75183.1 hypothetical protein DXZ75_19500 [Streptomyces sp. AcE210]
MIEEERFQALPLRTSSSTTTRSSAARPKATTASSSLSPTTSPPDAGWECVIIGTDEPADIECSIAAVDGDWSSEDFLFDIVDDDRLSARISLPDTGLYRITARADYGPEVTQLVFAGPDQVDDE